MRKLIAAATFGLVLGVAGASNPADQSPEARAYIGFNFGGAQVVPRNFHYGLRIDHGSRHVQGPAPALVQLDFTRAGFNLAQVNGMNVARQQYRLRQAEEPAAEEVPAEDAPAEAPAEATPEETPEEAPAEEAAAEEGAEGAGEQGFLGKIGAWFGGLFGGGDEEEAAAEETAESTEAAAEGATEETADAGETADGPFANYGLVDWGLLALGAVGLGYAVSEVSNSEESDDPAQPTTGAAPTGTTPVGATPVGATPVGATPIGIVSGVFETRAMDSAFRERLEWLDGGTGHMGDLNPQPE